MLWSAARRSLPQGLSHCLRPVFPQTSSFSSACPLHSSAGQGSQKEPKESLKRWALSVSPFTSLRAQLASCSISVSPLDPHAFPSADRAFITLYGVSEGQETALDHCHVHYDEESRELRVTEGTGTGCTDLDFHLEAPIKSNLFISAEGPGHVHISKMECDICKVSTQQGDCTLHSVKGHHVEVRSSGGHVTGLGTIHGNVDILTSGESTVDIKKLQGTTMNVSTEHGSMKVKAIYAESSSISSCTGRVELGLVHGGATVRNESGETVIDGSNGVLKVSSHNGLIDVYVGEGGSADIQSQQGESSDQVFLTISLAPHLEMGPQVLAYTGNSLLLEDGFNEESDFPYGSAVSVRVPSSVKAGLELCGSSVDISPEVAFHQTEKLQAPGQTTVTGFVNGDSANQPQVRARTTGPVTLRTQSWFESLKLTS